MLCRASLCLISFQKTSSSVLQEAGRDGTLDQGAYSGYTDDCDRLGSDTPCPRTRLGGPTKIHFTVDVVYSQARSEGQQTMRPIARVSVSTVLLPARLLSTFLTLTGSLCATRQRRKSLTLIHGPVGLVHRWKLKTDGSFILLQSRVTVLKELSSSSVVTDCDPMDCIAHLVPPSVEFFRQEYSRAWLVLSPGDLPNPGIEPVSAPWASRFFITEPPEKPLEKGKKLNS